MRGFTIEPRGEPTFPPSQASFAKSWEDLAQESRYGRHRLAKLVQVSVQTLDRHFKKECSVSVAHWLRDLQLNRAYQQVLSGKALKEISFDVGFKQASHFTKCFKSRFGIPPSFLLGPGRGR